MFWNRIVCLEWECRFSRKERCSSTLLKLGILLVTFLCNCETTSSQESSSFSKSSPQTKSSHHHSPWGTWSTAEISNFPWEATPHVMPNIVPLSLQEQAYPESTVSKKLLIHTTESHSSKMSHNANLKSKSKSSKRHHEENSKRKSGTRANDNIDGKDSDAKVDLAILRKQALEFGSLVVKFISNEMQPSQPAGESRGAGGFLSELANTFKLERREGGEGGESDHDHHRGVIDWLARLIGVQGKTLGEFLREYQVHVLYDLVFIFFKWIFFLYAGLLIP